MRGLQLANLLILLVVAAVVLLLVAKLDRFTVIVTQLNASIERHPEIIMANIPLTSGDTSLGRPYEAKWDSGTDTVIFHCYRATSLETDEEYAQRFLAELAEHIHEYPKN